MHVYTWGWALTPTASQHILTGEKLSQFLFYCVPDGVRTSSLWIMSPKLYQLSHPVTPSDLTLNFQLHKITDTKVNCNNPQLLHFERFVSHDLHDLVLLNFHIFTTIFSHSLLVCPFQPFLRTKMDSFSDGKKETNFWLANMDRTTILIGQQESLSRSMDKTQILTGQD